MSKELVVKEEEVKDLSIFAVEAGAEENLSQEELEIPFLRLAQKGSPQVDDDKAEFIEGLKPGEYFSTVSGSSFGSDIKVQVHDYFHNYTIWKGAKGSGEFQGTMTTWEFHTFEKQNTLERDGGDMVCYKDGEEYRYTDTHNFIISLPEYMEEGIMIYNLSSTGCRMAKRWNSLHTARRVPGGGASKRYSTIWELKTAGFEKNGYSWKQVSSIKPLGWVTQELNDFGKSFEDFTKSIKEQGVKYSDEGEASEESEESAF